VSAATAANDAPERAAEPWYRRRTLPRAARLWSGVILMVFVTTHLLNHALGIFGVEVMSEVQTWRSNAWRSLPGTILLLGATITHVAFALARVVGRRTWRMPWLEAFQIALGVAIPFLLLGHVVGTRVLATLGGVDDSYVNILRFLWPANAWAQSAMLVIVWGHGVIGLYYAFHVRPWFRSLRVAFAILAVLVPALALAGFVASGREAAARAAPGEAWSDKQIALQQSAMARGQTLIFAVMGAAVAIVGFRLVRARLRRRITVRYLGHGEVLAKSGLTLLEISRDNRIPHPSTCGGRGRCASCRVVVLQGLEALAPPAELERRMLERIGAPPQVRLACQVRPNADINVRVLFGAKRVSVDMVDVSDAPDWSEGQEVAVVFADIRGFSTLARNQLPSDLLVMLNRVMGEMIQAVEARDGRLSMVQTDGIMAVFGMGKSVRVGSRAALNAATDILKAVHLINKDIRAAFPQPIRVGIGVHVGPAVIARADDGAGGQRMVVIGETVVIASRLEEATKELAADCVASAQAIAAAGLSAPASEQRQLHYKNGAQPIVAYAFSDRQDLRSLLGRRAPPIASEVSEPAPPAEAAAPAVAQ
jgi:adenylate cyclase